MLSRPFQRRHSRNAHAIRRTVSRAAYCAVERMEDRTLFSFTTPVAYTPGTTPTSVIVGDFNGDGRQDVAQLNAANTTVSVLLGNGNGTFQTPVTSPAGGTGTTMVMADFNHDGHLDLVTCQGTTLDVLDGNGDGSFHDGGTYLCGAYADDVKACDINHDGWCDLETASAAYGGTTQVFCNDGTGGFLPPRNIAIGPLGQQLEVADVNDDGNPDLIEQGFGYNEVLLGDGTGVFRPAADTLISPNAQDVEVGDFNKDGMADLVVANGAGVDVYAGNAAGTYNTPTQVLLTNVNSVAIGDVNGDGNADIVTNNGFALLGRGDGSFNIPTPYGQGAQATGVAGAAEVALGDLNGDGHPDEVAGAPSGAGSGVSVALNGNDDTQRLAGATHFAVSAPAKAAAGGPFAVTVTALDASGNVVTNFQGSVAVVGGQSTQPVYYTFTAADNGTHTIPNAAEFFTTGTQTYSAKSPFLPTATGTIDVTGIAAAKFTVTSPASSVAGAPAAVTVSAIDAYGNPTASYWGTVTFSSTDQQAGLPARYTFTDADAGSHTFTVTYKTAGPQNVTVYDINGASVLGTSGYTTVTPSTAASLGVTGGGGYLGSVNMVHVTALDAYGNTATGYNGAVHLSTSDPNSTTSADAPLVNGAGLFTVTPMTVGQQTLTATDIATGDLIGTETITVTPGPGVHFSATPLSDAIAGQAQTTTLTVRDAAGNVSTGFTGTVAVRTTDPKAPLAYVSFGASDAGVKTIPVTLYTAGTQAVTISEYADSGVTITQAGIHVSPAAAATVSVTPLQGAVAGTTQNVTVSARDAYGNVATGYTGTVSFSSSDTQAALTADYTFGAADAGTHTFQVTFKSAAGQTFTVTDPANPATPIYSQNDILITPAALSGFSMASGAVSSLVAGTSITVTLSPTDAYGNVITNYTGTALFTSSDARAAFPSSYTFTAADAGSRAVVVGFATAGSQSITATDSTNGAITGSASFAIKAAAVSKLSVATSAAATAGLAQTVTVSATDAYGNLISNYSGTVKLASSDAAAVLPASYTFNNKDGGTHTFSVILNTQGTQSITAADSVNTLTGTQAGITVTTSKAPVASFSVTGSTSAVAGAARSFTVTARDTSGNAITGYAGTVTFSSSDQQAGLPAGYTFTAADNGSHTFSATFKTAGTQSISVQDAAAGVTSSQTGITVAAAAASRFVISAPASVTQGVGFKFTMTVYDAYGNVAAGYLGKVTLSSTDAKAGTSSYTFASSDKGVHQFSYTLNALGSQTIKVVDSANSVLAASAIINVVSK